MKSCSQCGFQNPDDIHICLRCAATLTQICPKCGAEVAGEHKFCGQCGTRLDQPAGAADAPAAAASPPGVDIQERLLKSLRARMPETLMKKITQASSEMMGQRREVTILCVDIANYRQVAQTIDSEELYLATDELMHLLTDAIYRFEGTIDQFTGQGLMALFGIPLNHENDPERAVRSALDMLVCLEQQRDRLQQRYHFDLDIRVGINTGSVIVGSLSAQRHMDYTVIGDTVNLATRLMNAATSGEILVSFNTYQRTRPIFEYKTPDAQPAKGSPTEPPAYQPLGLRLKPGQVRGIPGMHVPMVGRVDDFNTLKTAHQQVTQLGESQIVLISGDAGLGKSRLVAEFRNTRPMDEVSFYWGTCAAYMRITPYRVVADVLRSILNVSELDSPRVQRDALHAQLTMLNLDQHDIFPNLLHVLGLLQSDAVLEVRLKLLEPLMLQRQTQLALRTFFLAIARLSPTVFVFDDLHWVDQASQQFLEYFCQAIAGQPLLLVLVSRDFERNEPARLIAAAANKHVQPPSQIHLNPLSVQDSRRLVDQFIQEKTAQAISLKNTIIQRAAGNPYYTEELVRILIDYGGLIQVEGGWKVAAQASEPLTDVPGTLQDIILARFDRLPNHLRQTAQKASILGDSFAVRLLSVLFQGSSEELRANLDELEARDLLIHTRFANEDGYIFKHPLLQETIYKTLLKRDLRNLHFEIGQAIETGEHWLPGERNQILARHFAESHTPSKAIPYLLASAEKASQHFANETVVQLYRQALAIMETSTGIPKAVVGKAKIGLGQALKFSGQFDEAAQLQMEIIDAASAAESGEASQEPRLVIEALRELADIRSREGNLDQAVELLARGLELLGQVGRESDPISWRRLADRLAWVYFRQGKLEEAHNLADLALLDVKSWESDDPIILASLHNTIGGIYYTRSRHLEAIEHVERSLAIYQDLGYQWGMAISLTNLGVLNYAIGKWQVCIENLEQADKIRSEFGNHPERPINLMNLAEALIAIGDFERARVELGKSAEISRRLGSDIYLAYTEFALAHLDIQDEKAKEASLHLETARQLLQPFDEHNERAVQYHWYMALIGLQGGELAAALKEAEQALEISEAGGFLEKKVEVLRCVGMIQARMGNFALAESSLHESLEMKGGPFNEAQGICELGKLNILRAQKTPHEAWAWYKRAENELDRAISAFESLGARHALQHAQILRSSLPSSLEAPAGAPAADLNGAENAETSALRQRLGLPAGEWYHATLLALNLIPNQKVDEELLFETVAFLLPMLHELIHENGGKILRQQNGLIGVFGAPAAHEDDPERAVETAMQIMNFYNGLYQQTQLPVSMRLGVCIDVLVAGWQDNDPNGEFLAAGRGIQLARALVEVAAPSKVWVTQAVRNATAFRFEYTPIAIEMVEQLADKTIFQLNGEREQILPVRGLIGLKTVFIGRQSELESLLQLSQKLLNEGSGSVVWMEGEPGIGKSRLTREFESKILPQGALLWRGNCTARRSDLAFSVFSDLLSDALDIQPNFSPEQIYNQVERGLANWSMEPEIRPFVEMLVGVQPTGLGGEQLISLEPEQLRRQTFVALNRLLSRLANRQPLVLVLDDVQWIDSISADLLLYLSPLAVSHPVMFICAQRLNEPSAYQQTLERVRNMSSQVLFNLKLKPLSMQECRTLLDEFMGNVTMDSTLNSLIVQQSGGNPYFIEEFVRMLLEQNYLRVVHGNVEVNQSLQIDNLRIPSSLETLIRARVDALPVAARQLLQVASVVGHHFTSPLLSEVADRNNVQPLLDLLSNRGMLNQTSEADLWEFSHSMIEIIVYNAVLKAQRRILHHRTAQVLEAQWRGVEYEHAEELAYHFGKADEHAKTLDYLILAGERSASRHANETAVAYYEQASDLLSAVPGATPVHRWRIISGLGEVYQFTGNYEASMAVLQSGLEMLQNELLTPAQKAGLCRLVGETYLKKGDLDEAITNYQAALAIASETEDAAENAEAARIYARLGWCYFYKGDFEQAHAAVLKAQQRARLSNNLNALAAAENLLGGIYWSRGNLAQSMQHTRQAMAYWQEMDYTWGVAVTLNNLGILQVNTGDWNAAAQSFQKAFNLRLEMGDVEGMALAHNNLGQIALDQGKLTEAETAFRGSLNVSEPFQMTIHRGRSHLGLAQTLMYQGRLAEAEQVLQTGLKLADELEAREMQAELQRVHAQIALISGEFALAQQRAAEAASTAVEIGSNSIESSSRRIAAASLLGQGLAAPALAMLSENWERLSPNVDELETGRVHAQFARIYRSLQDAENAKTHHDLAFEILGRLGAGYDLQQLMRE